MLRIARLPRLASVHEAKAFEVTMVPHDAGRSIVRVRGELDLATCSQLEAALAAAPPGESIVLDLTECGFLDSAAIRVVLTSAERVGASGGSVSLVATDPGVLRVLEIASVATRVPLHPSVEAATGEPEP